MLRTIYLVLLILLLPALQVVAQDRDVVISEVFYDTPENESQDSVPNHNGEFIKLYNIEEFSVDISRWVLVTEDRSESSFKFPSGTILPPKGIVVVCYQYDGDFSFSRLFPGWISDDTHMLFYHKAFWLSNTAETIILKNSSYITIDRMWYGDNTLRAQNGTNPISQCYSLHRFKAYNGEDFGEFAEAEYKKMKVNPMTATPVELIQSKTFAVNYEGNTTTDITSGTTGKNYITKAIMKQKYNSGNININMQNAVLSTEYFDGLGRKEQTVLHEATNTNEDIVDFTEYDARGRVTKQWLPVIGQTMDGSFNDLSFIKSQSQEFYGDNYTYSSISYCETVENRIRETQKPGTTWHNNTGIITEYKLNTSVNELRCVQFEIDRTTGKLRKCGIYPNSELSVNISTDEDGEQIYTFSNMNDSTILTRTVEQDFIDTYYVYDVYGNLCYVLPPMASTELSERQDGIIESNDPILQKYAYIYTYDNRNNCITKKIPGAESIYMIYDYTNMLAYSQDGNQRPRNEWTYFAYDPFNRLAFSGIVTDTRSFSELRSTLGVYTARTNYTGMANDVYGYTQIIKYAKKSNIKIVNYYDNYEFLDIYGATIKNQLLYREQSGYDVMYTYPGSSILAKGYLTGSMVRMLDSSNKELIKAVYYDHKGGMVQSRETNHMDGYEYKYYKLNFTGKPLVYRHENYSATKNTLSLEEYTYDYDKLDRLLITSHSWIGGNKVVLARNMYTDLGQLSGIYINNKVTIGYGYDMRGWLTSISSSKKFTQTLKYATRSDGTYGCLDGNICEMNWSADGPTLSKPNIPLGISRRYSYYYDNIDRLVEAKYSEAKPRESPINVTFDNTPDYSTTYSYDLNSNITSLARKGIYEKYNMNGSEYWSYATVDSLAYTLDGNRPTAINDDALCYNPAYNGAFNFQDITYSDDEYTYDANGNMTSDSNKDITSIEYNYLNLPTSITFADGHITEYVYDASGTKRRAIYKVQPETLFAPVENSLENVTTAEQLVVASSKDYCDNHIYDKDGYLNMVLFDNGYIASGQYHFYIKDYQGNNRVVFNQNGDVEQVNHYYPYGGTFGEGIGTNEGQPYKYGGKELDRMNGLDMYDFGARQLDSATGGWSSTDPMAEKYYNISPYAYCNANPIRYVDPDGMMIWIYNMFYSPGMKYNGDDIFITRSIDYLNSIYENGGQKAIDKLTNSSQMYNFLCERPIDKNGNIMEGVFQFDENQTGGTILAGELMNNKISEAAKIESMSHELLHGVQADHGQGGASVFNEIEANVFSKIITENWIYNAGNIIGAISSNGLGNNTQSGRIYQNSFEKLAKTFSVLKFNSTVSTFKMGSIKNSMGLYNNYPIRLKNQKINLLQKYYPK